MHWCIWPQNIVLSHICADCGRDALNVDRLQLVKPEHIIMSVDFCAARCQFLVVLDGTLNMLQNAHAQMMRQSLPYQLTICCSCGSHSFTCAVTELLGWRMKPALARAEEHMSQHLLIRDRKLGHSGQVPDVWRLYAIL